MCMCVQHLGPQFFFVFLFVGTDGFTRRKLASSFHERGIILSSLFVLQVKLLLRHRADPKAVDDADCTPDVWARRQVCVRKCVRARVCAYVRSHVCLYVDVLVCVCVCVYARARA